MAPEFGFSERFLGFLGFVSIERKSSFEFETPWCVCYWMSRSTSLAAK